MNYRTTGLLLGWRGVLSFGGQEIERDQMNWIELIAEFYIEIIHYAAWPAVVLVILLVFREPIVSLLGRLKKIGLGDKFLEFMASELQEKVSEKVRYIDVTKETLKWEHFEGALAALGFNSGVLALELLGKPSKKGLQQMTACMFNITLTQMEKGQIALELLPFLRMMRTALGLQPYVPSEPK